MMLSVYNIKNIAIQVQMTHVEFTSFNVEFASFNVEFTSFSFGVYSKNSKCNKKIKC